MSGQPPRQHKHERRYTLSTHPDIPIRRIWNDDYDGQMIFGDLVGLKLPDVLQVKKNPEKTSPGKLVPTGDRTRARCVTGAHATACSSAVDLFHLCLNIFLLKHIVFCRLLKAHSIQGVQKVSNILRGGSMLTSHAAGPGSIPGRDKFTGRSFFRSFSLPVSQEALGPQGLRISFGRHNHPFIFNLVE